MATPGSIIDDLGGTGAVAAALSLSDSTVSGWRERGIPAPHWIALVRLASDKGQNGITLETFAELIAREPATCLEARP